jgi:hypothetical protein
MVVLNPILPVRKENEWEDNLGCCSGLSFCLFRSAIHFDCKADQFTEGEPHVARLGRTELASYLLEQVLGPMGVTPNALRFTRPGLDSGGSQLNETLDEPAD